MLKQRGRNAGKRLALLDRCNSGIQRHLGFFGGTLRGFLNRALLLCARQQISKSLAFRQFLRVLHAVAGLVDQILETRRRVFLVVSLDRFVYGPAQFASFADRKRAHLLYLNESAVVEDVGDVGDSGVGEQAKFVFAHVADRVETHQVGGVFHVSIVWDGAEHTGGNDWFEHVSVTPNESCDFAVCLGDPFDHFVYRLFACGDVCCFGDSGDLWFSGYDRAGGSSCSTDGVAFNWVDGDVALATERSADGADCGTERPGDVE